MILPQKCAGQNGAKIALNGCLCTALGEGIFTVEENGLFFAFLMVKWRYGISISQTETEEQWMVSSACCGASGAVWTDIFCFALAAVAVGLVYLRGRISVNGRDTVLPEPGADSPP